MNSLAADNPSGGPQRQRPQPDETRTGPDEAGTGRDFCDVIFSLLDWVSKDEPAGSEAEAEDPDKKSPGLGFFLSELNEHWAQIVRKMVDTGESEPMRTFAKSVAGTARELGSYIDAKKQFSVISRRTKDYTSRTAATDDLHKRKEKLRENVRLLCKQCRALGKTTGNAARREASPGPVMAGPKPVPSAHKRGGLARAPGQRAVEGAPDV